MNIDSLEILKSGRRAPSYGNLKGIDCVHAQSTPLGFFYFLASQYNGFFDRALNCVRPSKSLVLLFKRMMALKDSHRNVGQGMPSKTSQLFGRVEEEGFHSSNGKAHAFINLSTLSMQSRNLGTTAPREEVLF